MRAIHLSLMQRSTQTNQRSRQSSSSSSSTSSYRDQAHGVQAPQDMSYLSAVDGASLQKAIELSLRDSAVGGGNIRLFLLVKLKTQGCHFLSKKWTGYHVKVLLESKGLVHELTHPVQQNKQYHLKVLLISFYMNGHLPGFYPQTENLEPLCTAWLTELLESAAP